MPPCCCKAAVREAARPSPSTTGGRCPCREGLPQLTNVGGSGHGSRALIQADGDAQQITLNGGGSIDLTGGTAGSRSYALVYAPNGTQTISGASAITLTGGASGGIAGEGNSAALHTDSGSQTISAGAITMRGGDSGTENLAQMRQGLSANPGTQTVTVLGGGTLALQGGGGVTNLARIQSNGASQTLNFASGGALTLDGGTGTSNNFARVQSLNGAQRIDGSPDITVTGGTGGADLAGNFADIRANLASATQTIHAANLALVAGASGQENSAHVGAANQIIDVSGDLTLTGGGSATSLDGSSGGGARIGGAGTATKLALTVANNVTLTGGTAAGAGAAIGSNRMGGLAATISIDAGGSIQLHPGTNPSAGSRIGSPAAAMGGGSIDLTAGNAITLAGSVAGETAIRTLGSVTLDSGSLSIGNLVSGATVQGVTSNAMTLSGVGQVNAGALSGDSLTLVAGTTFSNTAGASALVTTAPARWLVYSNDPANDARGGLVAGFKQYNKAFGDAIPIVGTGNGWLYTVAPTATVGLTGSVSKVYDGTTLATLTAGNFLAIGGIDGDTVSVGGSTSASYDTRNVGTAKVVSASGITIAALDGTTPVYGYGLAGGMASGPIGAITAAPLTVSTTAVNKTYDATTAAPGGAAIITSGALVAGDTLAGGNFAFVDPNAGSGKSVTVSGVTINDGNGGNNYSLTLADNTASSISAAALTLSTSNVIKTYDGTTLANGVLVLTSGSLFGSDTVGGGNFAFTNKNAGAGNKTVTVGGATLNDGNGGANYLVSYTNNTSSTINPANLTLTANPVSRSYDGSVVAIGSASVTGGALASGDTLGATTLQFDSKHVGSGKTVSITSAGINDGNAGANYNLSLLPDTGSSITPASLVISTSPVSKIYDGNTLASGSAVVTAGYTLFSGDTLSGGSFAYSDRNVGAGNKTVTVAGVSVNDGNGGANYSVSYADNTSSSITRRAVSTWTGAAGNHLWSSASNWDALPDASNVGAVSIPSGAGTVSLDVGVDLQSISSGSPINQVSGGSLTSSALDLLTQGGLSLTSSDNRIAQLTAANSGSGNFTLVNGVPLSMGRVSNSSGNITVTNTGAVNSNGPVVASGDVRITALSPLTIGAGGVNAGGNVVLTAGNLSSPGPSDNLTLDGPVTAGNTVGLYAGNNLVQNTAVLGLNGVTAEALGSMRFGPLATTNNPSIVYTAGGRPVTPPPTGLASDMQATGDILVTFLDLLQDVINSTQDDGLELNPDGSKKKKSQDGVVAEEELCR